MTTDTTASSAAETADPKAAATRAGTNATTAAAKTTTVAAQAPQTTLRQFGIDVSTRDTRVTLLHGFVFEETAARRFKDTEANYLARFAQFANKPV